MSATQTLSRTHVSPRWSSPLHTADGQLLPSHGGRVCRWIEENCVYGEGDWFGQPVELREWQRLLIWRLYEYYPATGLRRYKRALWGMAKGNGKTPLAAWIGAYELGGGSTLSPHVIIGAASLKQANLVFGDLKVAVTGTEQAPSPMRRYVDPFDLQVLLKEEPGVAERIAAEAGTNDGSRATTFIADELHEWTGRTEDVYDIVDGAVAKRKNGFTLAITTAGMDSESLVQRLYEYGKKLASGELVDDEFLFVWWEAPEHLDPEDPEQFEEGNRAANPAYGDFCYPEQLLSRFRKLPRYKYIRYHWNRPTKSETQWLPARAWDSLATERTVPEGSEIALAFKGTYDNKAAALVGVADGHIFVLGSWERPDEDYQVPRSEVDAAVKRAMETYKVRRLACDPPGWYAEIQDWAEAYGDRVVVQYESRMTQRFSAACSKFYSAVMDAKLTHDGSPSLARHLEAATPKEAKEGTYIVAGNRVIVTAVAAVLAYDTATSGKTTERKAQRITFF